MKQFEDMTIKEIRELKEQYRKDFIESCKEFFKTHPLVDTVQLIDGNGDSIYDDNILLTRGNCAKRISYINLKNESEL